MTTPTTPPYLPAGRRSAEPSARLSLPLAPARRTRRVAGALVGGLLAAAAPTMLSSSVPAAAATAPTAPASCSATWHRDGWSISWTKPASDGGSAITEYRVNELSDGDPLVKLGATATTMIWTTPLTFPDRRKFVIRAKNALGVSNPCTAAVPLADIPRVVPKGLQPTVSSQKVANSYGVAAHPVFRQTAYQNVDAWMERLASMGVKYFRGNYAPGNPGTAAAVAAARKHNVKWLMIVVNEAATAPTTQTLAQTRATVEHVADNAADVVYAFQGLNEPNHNRGGGVVPANWAQIATDHQRVIWQTAKAEPALAKVPVIGPSVQETNADASYDQTTSEGGPQHYHQLVDAGILAYQDYAGTHNYAGGGLPTNGLDRRVDLIRSAYGVDYPVWIDESGYHNALVTDAGHRPASEAAAATYAPRLLLEYSGQRGLRVGRYEALDDVDPGEKDVHESNFGLWRVGSFDPANWSEKPEVAAMRSILGQLEDPGPAYTPAPVSLGLSGPGDMDYVVTRKRDGSATLWLWRDVSIWDAVARVPVTVEEEPVTVTDASGEETVQVAGEVVSVPLDL